MTAINITIGIWSDVMRSIVKRYTYDLIQEHNGYENLLEDYKALIKSQFLKPEDQNKAQLNKVKSLLVFANENVPFYKKRFKDSGLDVHNIQSLDDLKKIPPLTKDDIRRHKEDLLSPICHQSNNCVKSMSGGTTGPSIELYNSIESVTYKLAAQHRFDSWAGWEKGDWSSIIWPAAVDFNKKPPKFRSKIKNFLSSRSILLQQTTIDDNEFEQHFVKVMNRRPSIVKGFPSQLTLAADYVLQNGVTLPSIKGVISTGEVLLVEQRIAIQKAFGCPVYDSYRTREVGCIAQECDEHNGLHINAEQVFVEIKSQDESENNNEGKILVTDLVNYAMPFIRYEIGDIGVISERRCSCGRGLPILENIGGRISDQLYATDGKQISPVAILPNLFHLLGIDNQFRILQENLNEITIQMVKPKPSEQKLKQQQNAARSIFGSNIVIHYDYVNSIAPVSSGKYPIVLSKVKIPNSG